MRSTRDDAHDQEVHAVCRLARCRARSQPSTLVQLEEAESISAFHSRVEGWREQQSDTQMLLRQGKKRGGSTSHAEIADQRRLSRVYDK